METTLRPAEVFTLKPAKRRKKKAGVAAAAVCGATPAARMVREGSVEKTVKKKKKKKKAALGAGLMDRAVCAASSSSAVEPRAVAAIATKEDGLEGIFASLTEKKAARDAKRKVREEEEEAEAAAAAAAAKKAAKEARDLPRDSVFGEVYDPNSPFDPMSASIHRVRRRGQKLEPRLRARSGRLHGTSQGHLVGCAALWGEYRRALGPQGSRTGTAKVRSWVYTPLALTLQVDQTSGYNVYKAHALGLGRGGGTPLCPFDCKCCY